MASLMTYTPSTSVEAVQKATGKSWEQWFGLLDAAGAREMDHKQIVAWLRQEAGLTKTWWQQNVTVEYEKARGKRAMVGETSDAGFQVGAQRTVAAPAERVWEWLTSRPGRDVWLGNVAALPLEQGHKYLTDEGVAGEIRSVRSAVRLRLTWQPREWDNPSTLQLTLTHKGERCTVGFHQEKLPDAEARAAMRQRWLSSLDEIAAALC